MPHVADQNPTRRDRSCSASGRTSPVSALLEALRGAVGAAHVLVDDDLRAPYETDWTRRWSGRGRAVVRPGSVEEVGAILRACGEHGAAVVPQGGNTGLVGAGVPRGTAPTHGGGPREQVVLSLARFTALGEVDGASMQVSAGAGVTLAALHAQARAAGLDAGVDFAARDSAMLGGLVACDAGGVRALRHGTVRARVAGLEAVLADGDRRAPDVRAAQGQRGLRPAGAAGRLARARSA